MATTPTANFGWQTPNNNADNNNWGIDLIAEFSAIDATVFGIQTTANAALPATGGTMTGALNAKTGTVAATILTGVTGTQNIDLSTANAFGLVVTGNVVLSMTNVPSVAAAAVPLIVSITNGGSHVTWPAGFKWANGTGAPALTTSGTDVLAFISFNQGSTWLEVGFQQNVS